MSSKSKAIPDTETYRTLVDSLAILTDHTNQLAALEAMLQTSFTELVDVHRDEYAILQSGISESEASIKLLAGLHPEWFETVKTIKTPYGTVGYRSSTKLEIDNEELTIALIERLGEDAAIYLRQRQFLNLEALETLDDGDLKKLRVRRVTSDKCTVTPAKVDLGKAVKKAVPATV